MSSILIIEDDDDVAEAEEFILADAGYKPVRAADGEQGLARLRTMDRPCVVLLDLMMPGMNGWEFLERVGHDNRYAAIPVVVTTSGSAEGLPGARAVMQKPYGEDMLLTTVGRYCPQPGRPPPRH
jgi:CheY-like chemotaxis protein